MPSPNNSSHTTTIVKIRVSYLDLYSICFRKQTQTRQGLPYKTTSKSLSKYTMAGYGRRAGILNMIGFRYWVAGSKGWWSLQKGDKWVSSIFSFIFCLEVLSQLKCKEVESKQRRAMLLSWGSRGGSLDVAKAAGIFKAVAQRGGNLADGTRRLCSRSPQVLGWGPICAQGEVHRALQRAAVMRLRNKWRD